ncbi:DUF2333 family protein [Thiocapsa rosea]|uniref:Uncharacterized protein DUF2333 n=1 Tax=Thiocapsa rosea TaxID=69360 RepID=A0A495V3S5_9GAMM|nr:DUF2333 family protein [Thiocapsa rosea]RKT43243.1 uncharacterized protein DUF2333 [Thiocapsa rosea]
MRPARCCRAPTPGLHRAGWRTASGLLGLVGLVLVSLGVYWSIHPTGLDGAAAALAELCEPAGDAISGVHTVTMAVGIGDALLTKPGGFLYNDRSPPGVFLDNTQSWECGNLMALRDFVRALRNDFTRSQSQSVEKRLGHFGVRLSASVSDSDLASYIAKANAALMDLRILMQQG